MDNNVLSNNKNVFTKNGIKFQLNQFHIFSACAKTKAAYLLAAACILLFQPGCFPRPLDLQLKDSTNSNPVAGVTIHRHSVTLLSLLATDSNAVKSDALGDARIWVPPFNTKLTLLQPGFEPSTVDVFTSKTTTSMLASDNSSIMMLRLWSRMWGSTRCGRHSITSTIMSAR